MLKLKTLDAFLKIQGTLDIVKLLIEKGADINASNIDGKTPLDIAKEKGHSQISAFLLNIELFNTVRQGNLSKIKDYINKGADINAKDSEGKTSLHNAAVVGNLNMVELLIEKGASVNIADSKYNKTALHYAALYGKESIVNALLEAKGIDVNAKDDRGCIPLHSVAQKGYTNIAKALIEHGADINTKSEHNLTPLHYAARGGHLDIIKLLVEKGADIKVLSTDGKTPLDIAKINGRSQIIEFLSSVISRGHSSNGQGLFDPIEEGSLNKAEELVEKRTDISSNSSLTHLKWTPESEKVSQNTLAQHLMENATDPSQVTDAVTATHHLNRRSIDLVELGSEETSATSSANKPTPWMGDLLQMGKNLINKVVDFQNKPAAGEPTLASDSYGHLNPEPSSKSTVVGDSLGIGKAPLPTATGPTVLEMGDQWVNNTDTNGLFTWATLLARKRTGYRPKAVKVPSETAIKATNIIQAIQSHEIVDAFMNRVEEHAQACSMEEATSDIFENLTLYTQAVQEVRKKLASGETLETISDLLCNQVVERNISQIASASSRDQANQLLCSVKQDLPNLEQALLKGEQNYSMAKEDSTESPDTMQSANVNKLIQDMCNMCHPEQLPLQGLANDPNKNNDYYNIVQTNPVKVGNGHYG